MDLTTSYPSSVREKLLGIVQLKRTIDKGKAAVAGTLGEYLYDCPMDKHLFAWLGMDGNDLLAAIRDARDDEAILTFVRPYVNAKTDDEIAAFNVAWLEHGPEAGTPAEGYFNGLRAAVAPDRTDVTTWADLLDLDERRDVPRRVAA
jgi:hypothetical protein